MDKVLTCLLMEIHTLALTWLASLMVRVSTSGQMEAPISVSLRRASSTARAGGRKAPYTRIATNTRENTSMIKRMDTGFSPGKAATYTKEVIKMMREMDMARCSGQMAQPIQELG
jgi:hypothetical protein